MAYLFTPAAVVLTLGIHGFAHKNPVTIKRVPQLGQVVNYSIKGNLNLGGEDLNFSVERSCDTVTAINPDGSYTRKSVDSGVTLGGKPSEDSTMTITTKADGELVDVVDEAKESAARRLSLSLVYYPDHPVSVGDTWIFNGSKNEALGVRSFRSTQKYLGEETLAGKKTFKIEQDSLELEGAEAPSYHSVIWVEEDTGVTMKSDATFKNIQFGALPVSGHLVYTIIDPALKSTN